MSATKAVREFVKKRDGKMTSRETDVRLEDRSTASVEVVRRA